MLLMFGAVIFRLAVSYRLSRKQALQGVIDSVDKYLKGLGEAKKKAKGGKSSSVAAPPSHSTDRLAAIVKEFNEWFLASACWTVSIPRSTFCPLVVTRLLVMVISV
jgi:hypothetical protein